MSPDGSDQRRFTGNIGGIQPGAQGDGIGVPTLSPDGSEVLVPLNGTTAINLATGARRAISVCAMPVVWSPDGKALACAGRSVDLTSPISVVTQPGGAKRALPGTKGDFPVAWSPDGQWILYTVEGYGPAYLWRIHPDGTGRRRISRFTPSYATEVMWRPDGRAEFVGTASANSTAFEKLVAVDVNGGKATILRTIRTPDTATWSPDGSTLAFATAYDQDRPGAIYTVDVSGSSVRRLTPPGKRQYDSSPAWSPDGKNIVFVRQRGRGAERYAWELWTMNADGSQQRQLTHAYPSGGENVEPLWVSGAVQSTDEPFLRPIGNDGHTVGVPWPVAGVTARRARVAVAPYGANNAAGLDPTPPLLVWRPGSRPPKRLVGSLCGTITPEFFTGRRLVIACDADFLDEHRQAILSFDLRSAIPTEPVSAYNSFFGPGTQFGTVVAGPVLSGGRTVFETSRWISARRTRTFTRTKLRRQILWAADGSGRTRLRSAYRLGTLIAGDRHWLAFLAHGGVQITTPGGRRANFLHLPPLHVFLRAAAPTYLLAGDRLIRLGAGTLQSWNVRTGQLLLDRSVPAHASLDAADGACVVYTAGADLHVVSRLHDKVIHTPAKDASWNNRYDNPPLHPVYAALTSVGLVYTYDVKSAGFPGRVVFVPRSALPR